MTESALIVVFEVFEHFELADSTVTKKTLVKAATNNEQTEYCKI